MSSTVMTTNITTDFLVAPASGSYGARPAGFRPLRAAFVGADHGTPMSRQGLVPLAVGTGVEVCPGSDNRLRAASVVDEFVATITRHSTRPEPRAGESL